MLDDDFDESKKDKAAEMLTHPSYDELMQKLTETEQKADQHWERVLRLQADMDNLVRRHELAISNVHKFAIEKFVLELLPIIDSLELCIVNSMKGESAETLIEGVTLTLKMFQTATEKFGMQVVNPLLEAFNPEHHQAISMQADASVKSNTVVSVLQKGYLLHGRLIRPALVVVAKNE